MRAATSPDGVARVFFRRQDLARILDCDPRTIDRGIEQGLIPAVRIGKMVRIPAQAACEALGLDPTKVLIDERRPALTVVPPGGGAVA